MIVDIVLFIEGMFRIYYWLCDNMNNFNFEFIVLTGSFIIFIFDKYFKFKFLDNEKFILEENFLVFD